MAEALVTGIPADLGVDRRTRGLPEDLSDLDACRIRITQGKGAKGRTVPLPNSLKETLALHIDAQRAKAARLPVRVRWKKPY